MVRDDGYTRYTVRIPTPLYERVKADAGEKSVNAAIVAVLEEKYPPELTMEALHQWAREIRQLGDRGKQQRRLTEVNQTLASDPVWSRWRLQLATLIKDDGSEEQGVVVWEPQGFVAPDEDVPVVRD